jgi:hypothetical protein
MLWESAGLELAEDQLAVHVDVKDTTGACHKLGLDVELFLDRFRQTGGFG